MDTYFYYYKINYFDDMAEHTTTGITYGSSWADAIKHLTDYYGDANIVELIYFGIFDNGGGDCLEIQDLDEMIKQAIKQEDEE